MSASNSARSSSSSAHTSARNSSSTSSAAATATSLRCGAEFDAITMITTVLHPVSWRG
jgi:hypothetical protein